MGKVGALVLLAGIAGCGRIGYDPLAGTDGPPEVDADELAWFDTACGVPVMIGDVGASLVPAAPRHLLDVAETDTGFVIAWSAGHGTVSSTALAADGAGRLAVRQSQAELDSVDATAISAAALGDDVLVGVDDGTDILLYPLDRDGYSRAANKSIEDQRGVGHEFVSVKPQAAGFIVVGGTATETSVFTRDVDAHPITGPHQVFPRATAGSGAAAFPTGYVVLSKQPAGSEHCDVVPVDRQIAATGALQEIPMTCHNASVVASAAEDTALAAWNCNNDAVWVSAGAPGAAMSAPRAVFSGSSGMSATNPRMAIKTVHLWYAYQVEGGNLGAAIVAEDGSELRAPAVVHTSPRVAAYDLIARGDYGYLVWLEAETRDELWAMRLCP